MQRRAKAAIASLGETKGGFELHEPVPRHMPDFNAFRQAVTEQTDAVTYEDAGDLHSIDITGGIDGLPLRLTRAAFSDLCHFSDIPVRFIKALSRVDESLALEVIRESLKAWFHTEKEKWLVVDSRDHTVEGIVGVETYKPVTNVELLDWAASAVSSLNMTNGWLCGSMLRMTLVRAKPLDVNPQIGDIVQVGIDVGNAMNGDRAVTVVDYAERLSCTNGMRAKEVGHATHLVHRGDVKDKAQQYMVEAAQRADFIVPLMEAAVGIVLTEGQQADILTFVEEGKNGGSKSLGGAVLAQAKIEAAKENHEAAITLWNMVNGVTMSAHTTKTLQHRSRLEALGYYTLSKFGVELAAQG